MPEPVLGKPLLRSLAGETLPRPPIWLMRQAGRYLPEYRAVRAKAGGFLKLCYSPEDAAEVTLQPIRRFGFDAAILFADILLIPQSLGQKLWFVTGEGPRLAPITDASTLRNADEIHETLGPIYETVRMVRGALPPEVALIGFAGAPWTVATYMIAGRGTPDQAPAHALMRRDPTAFNAIIDRVVEATIAYLSRQIEAGADAIKLFDSWAGSLTGSEFESVCVEPNRRIVEALRLKYPGVPAIGFPRGVGEGALRFVRRTRVDGIAIGQEMDLGWARDHLQKHAAVQGNIDPQLMITGGDELRRAVETTIETLSGGPHILNLGHGITPDADPANVDMLVRLVKG
ncbi:uroporphyrinogen decarboxylase [Pikeienuella piscinae]|uniref:Uroporphyrinogen decarboxylase n=1 Tax=Pikeienuella piscinae TaxID=2748098 RepID=A0A7L5BYU8_9RHOB|nr:uroporphyrinogen decarboxylase [Pikeienuella piscinae]QIE56293.1 uroporphyrinogen decarboxylase [Pikeienuella piscinae]